MHRSTILSVLAFSSSVLAHTGGLTLHTKRATCSTPEGDGTCVSTSSCTGFSVAGYCPGAADVQCCISKSCSNSQGSGTCMDTSKSCSGGAFVAGSCPGSSSIQCCTKGASSGAGGSTPPASSSDPHPLNAASIQLIESLEGFRSNSYKIDGDVTIGYGHDCTQRGDCASIPDPISQPEAEALFKKDLVEYEDCVCKQPNASKLNANQFGALTSFTYNSGCGGLTSAFSSYFASGDFAGACKALPGKITNGGELSSRRQRESELCSTATSEMSGC